MKEFSRSIYDTFLDMGKDAAIRRLMEVFEITKSDASEKLTAIIATWNDGIIGEDDNEP